MNNFEEIIKKGVEQFEVPYNEAHWAEMDGRLNKIRSTKIRNNVLGSITAIAIVAISSYFIFFNTAIPSPENGNTIAIDNSIKIDNNNVIQPLIEENKLSNTIKKEPISANEINPEENKTQIEVNENEIVTTDIVKEIVSDNETVVLNNILINAEFIAYNNKVCLGETVSFESAENDQPVSYLWNFGDGTISYEANPTHSYGESHIYTVSLTLLNRQTGKEHTTIQEDVVTILPIPTTGFVYTEESKKHDDNKLKYPYTAFNVKNVSKENTYKWTFENGETYLSASVKFIFKEAGDYDVTIVATNSYGCSTASTKKVTIANGSDIYVQDAFNPNSTIAENETFIPKALLEWDVQFKMTIIDKSGKVVYQTADKTEPWNGKMNNTGQLLEEGVYLWQIITYDAEGTPHRHNGKINLIK